MQECGELVRILTLARVHQESRTFFLEMRVHVADSGNPHRNLSHATPTNQRRESQVYCQGTGAEDTFVFVFSILQLEAAG